MIAVLVVGAFLPSIRGDYSDMEKCIYQSDDGKKFDFSKIIQGYVFMCFQLRKSMLLYYCSIDSIEIVVCVVMVLLVIDVNVIDPPNWRAIAT